MKRFFLIILLTLALEVTYSHNNKTISQDFGNVKVLFTTGFYYEEINKALIIGEYTQKLAKQMQFNSKITLWFLHYYKDSNQRFYNVTHSERNDLNKKDEIFIKMKDYDYDICTVLSLIEFSINNFDSIGKWQGDDYLKNMEPPSQQIVTVLANKVYRPKVVDKLNKGASNAAYFFQKGKFHFYKSEGEKETIFLSLDNIYQLAMNDKNSYIIFDTKKSFYFTTLSRLDKPLNQMLIENVKNHYVPYKVQSISHNLTSITFSKMRLRKDERVVIFDHDKKVVFQNILSLLKTSSDGDILSKH